LSNRMLRQSFIHSMVATRQFRISLRRQAETQNRRRSAYRFIKKIEELETQNHAEKINTDQSVTNELVDSEAYRIMSEKYANLQQESKRMLTEVVDQRDKLVLQADALQKVLEEERQTGKDNKLKANMYQVMERKLSALVAEKEDKILAAKEQVENLERNLAFEKQAFYDFDKLFDCIKLLADEEQLSPEQMIKLKDLLPLELFDEILFQKKDSTGETETDSNRNPTESAMMNEGLRLLRRQLNEKNYEVNTLRVQLADVTVQNDTYERQLKTQVFNRNQLESQLERLEHEHSKVASQLKSKDFDIQQSNKKLKKSEKRSEKLRELVEELGAKLGVSSEALEEHVIQLEALTSEKEVLESIVESHQQNYEQAMVQIKIKERRIDTLEQNMETLQTRVKNMSDDEIRHKYNQLLNKHNSLDEQRMLELAELHAAIKEKDKDLDELWALVKNAPDVTKSEIAIEENESHKPQNIKRSDGKQADTVMEQVKQLTDEVEEEKRRSQEESEKGEIQAETKKEDEGLQKIVETDQKDYQEGTSDVEVKKGKIEDLQQDGGSTSIEKPEPQPEPSSVDPEDAKALIAMMQKMIAKVDPESTVRVGENDKEKKLRKEVEILNERIAANSKKAALAKNGLLSFVAALLVSVGMYSVAQPAYESLAQPESKELN